MRYLALRPLTAFNKIKVLCLHSKALVSIYLISHWFPKYALCLLGWFHHGPPVCMYIYIYIYTFLLLPIFPFKTMFSILLNPFHHSTISLLFNTTQNSATTILTSLMLSVVKWRNSCLSFMTEHMVMYFIVLLWKLNVC